MQNLKCSIITPSFNQGKFIEETILSVITQSYQNIEYLIIDGGSTDNTIDILKEYNNRITYWISEKDRGQTHAINKGFSKATGDIIAWLNSDDIYCTNAIAVVIEYFESHPDCMWLAGNEIFIDSKGKPYIRKYPNSSRWLETTGMMSIYQPNVFLRREILTTVGFLREDFHMAMDYEWYCRIAQKYPIHIINYDIAKFRWHDDSKSSQSSKTKAYKRYLDERLLIIDQCHPNLTFWTKHFPRFTLFLWFKIEKFLRFMNRAFKNELYKLNDKNILT